MSSLADDDKGPDCWICYDPTRTDAGPMIHPCQCRGDVGSVHHDCLRRWLVEVSKLSIFHQDFVLTGIVLFVIERRQPRRVAMQGVFCALHG